VSKQIITLQKMNLNKLTRITQTAKIKVPPHWKKTSWSILKLL